MAVKGTRPQTVMTVEGIDEHHHGRDDHKDFLAFVAKNNMKISCSLAAFKCPTAAGRPPSSVPWRSDSDHDKVAD